MAALRWRGAATQGQRSVAGAPGARRLLASAAALLCLHLWTLSRPAAHGGAFALGVPGRLRARPLERRPRLACRARGGAGSGSREEVKAELFQCLDVDGDGLLNSGELRRFAECTGFEGSADDWADEYGFLCSSLGRETSRGLDAASFGQLVDDDSEDGCYCSDAELAAMLGAQRMARPGGAAASPSARAAAVPVAAGSPAARGTAGMEYFAEERKRGLYETSWKAWDPSEGLEARSPRVGSIPGMAGCPSTATPQEAVMFLFDQVQAGIFGDAGPSVEARLGDMMALAADGGSGGAGWFDLRLEESASGEEELAKLVLAPEGWPKEKALIPKGYMMHILSVGRGVKSTLCGRESTSIADSLHRDVSKCGQLCDTCLCGVVGRKRVVLFAPDEFRETTGWARKPDLTSHDLHTLAYVPEGEAWLKLEETASRPDVMGGVLTLEPGRFVFVPHGWWHAVQPVDGFTFITGPSRLSGLAAATQS